MNESGPAAKNSNGNWNVLMCMGLYSIESTKVVFFKSKPPRSFYVLFKGMTDVQVETEKILSIDVRIFLW